MPQTANTSGRSTRQHATWKQPQCTWLSRYRTARVTLFRFQSRGNPKPPHSHRVILVLAHHSIQPQGQVCGSASHEALHTLQPPVRL